MLDSIRLTYERLQKERQSRKNTEKSEPVVTPFEKKEEEAEPVEKKPKKKQSTENIGWDGKHEPANKTKLAEDLVNTFRDAKDAVTTTKLGVIKLGNKELPIRMAHHLKKLSPLHDASNPHQEYIDSVIESHIKSPRPDMDEHIANYIDDISEGDRHTRSQFQHLYGYALRREGDSTIPKVDNKRPGYTYTHEQLQKYKSQGLTPLTGDILEKSHNADSWHKVYYQAQKDGSLKRVMSAKPLMPFSTSEDRLSSLNHGDTKKTMSDLEQQIPSTLTGQGHIQDYTEESSKVNSALYHEHFNHPIDDHDEHEERLAKSDAISGAIRSITHKPSNDFHVYTGLSRETNIRSILENDQNKGLNTVPVRFPSFVSTSLSRHIATGFAMDKFDHDQNFVHGEVLKLKVPAGHERGAYVNHYSENPGEYEYLLDKDHTIHVKNQKPTYFAKNGLVFRQYEGHILPKGGLTK